MVRLSLALIVMALLMGCNVTEYVPQYKTVEIPVIVYRDPEVPVDLLEKFTPSSVSFINRPGLVCMDPSNAALMRYDLEMAAGKLRAWRAFHSNQDRVQ